MNLWADDNTTSMMEAFLPSSDLNSSFPWLSSSLPSTAAPPPPQPPSQPVFFNQENLQQRLQTLIEGDRLPSWTYAIFWQSSVDSQSGASLLGWGDGYYKGCEEDKRKQHTSTVASAAEQEHRKRVLRELNSLIAGGGSDDAVEEEVTDTEWLFLVSMTQSFVNGSGLPGQAMFSGNPIWLAGGHALATAHCERAQQANMLGFQTMVCVPVGNGVLELGSTEVIMSSSEMMGKVRVLFNFGSGLGSGAGVSSWIGAPALQPGPSSGVGPDSNVNPDWRSQLQPDARQRIVNKIMDTLKRHLPVPVPEGINELQRIAVRFEEKIYSAATSQPDYLRKISLKMLSMENKTQPGLNPSLPNQNWMDPGVGMTLQQPSSNTGQSLASRQQQPLLQGSPNMPMAGPGGPSGATITPMSGPSISNSNPVSGLSGTTGPTVSLSMDMYSNTQRRQQPHQLTPQNQILYHQQQLVMRHKLQQQQQQTQMLMSSALAGGSGMMSAAPTGGMQQSQLNSVQQQPVGQGGSFQQLPLMWQQPQSTMSMQQTNNVTDLQQQRLQMQQKQMQQSQMQQNQMQQNQLQPNQMQQNQMLNQQMMLGQQQNQLLGSGGAGNMNNMLRQLQMQRQAGLLQQQQQQQEQQQQPQQQQHLLSQLHSQQQQLPQQQQASMMQQREMQMSQQRMQGSPALLQTQNNNAIDPQRQQQQQFIPQQQQRVLQDVASSPASMDSTAQTGNPGDWQEEMYQRLKYLKDTYSADLREIHQKLSMKLSQLDSLVPPNARGGEQIEKMKHFKMVLERMMAVLQLGKHQMQIGLKDKLSLYEKQIQSILQNHKAPQQQPQAGAPPDQPHYPGLQQSQPGLPSQQLPQQDQPQQMDNQNQLQQQLNTSAMPQLNNMGMPNSMQQGIQNTLLSDQHQANGTGFGSLQQGAMGSSMQNAMNPPQMVGSGAAIGSSNMSHTVTMGGMQTNMSSAQVLKPQQQHQEQQIQPQHYIILIFCFYLLVILLLIII